MSGPDFRKRLYLFEPYVSLWINALRAAAFQGSISGSNGRKCPPPIGSSRSIRTSASAQPDCEVAVESGPAFSAGAEKGHQPTEHACGRRVRTRGSTEHPPASAPVHIINDTPGPRAVDIAATRQKLPQNLSIPCCPRREFLRTLPTVG